MYTAEEVPNETLYSFVGTYMEREADALMMENISKNMSDADEYPAMMVGKFFDVLVSYSQRTKVSLGYARTYGIDSFSLMGRSKRREGNRNRNNWFE